MRKGAWVAGASPSAPQPATQILAVVKWWRLARSLKNSARAFVARRYDAFASEKPDSGTGGAVVLDLWATLIANPPMQLRSCRHLIEDATPSELCASRYHWLAQTTPLVQPFNLHIRQTARRPAASFNMVVPERPTRPAARPSTAAALRIQPSSFIWAQCYHSGSGLVPYRGFSHGCCRYTSQRSRMIETRLQLSWLHPKRLDHGEIQRSPPSSPGST